MDYSKVKAYINVLKSMNDTKELEKIKAEYPHLYENKKDCIELQLFNKNYEKELLFND